MDDFDSSRPAELYSRTVSGQGAALEGAADAGLEPPGEQPLAQAMARLEQVHRQLAELVRPEADETPAQVLGNLTAFCDRAHAGIGEYFTTVCGTPDPDLTGRADGLAEAAVPSGLSLGWQDLQELQGIRLEVAEIRSQLQEIERGEWHFAPGAGLADPEGGVAGAGESPAELTHPLFQLREDLTSVSLLLQELTARPPEGRTAEPVIAPTLAPEISPAGTTETAETVEVAGDAPETDRPYVFQQGQNDLGEQNTCGVATQVMVLNRLEGGVATHTETELLHEAVAEGAYVTGAGTPLEDYGKVLEEHGCHVERDYSGNIEELAGRLEHGEQAICSVNAGILWNDPTAYGNGEHNHAVWVSSVIYAEQGGQRAPVAVVVNDSGRGEQYSVPIERFEAAWGRSDHFATFCSK